MKNLSKVLALVLALALAMTMFAGAAVVDYKAYPDDEKFTSAAGRDAVAVLTALGIVNGYPDGEFKPAGNVSRAEFAKMITVAKIGGTDVSFYATSSLPFKDTANHWALSYLNYANLNAIMVGYGDGTARPDANVTGAEAVKMTLVALGYNPKTEGLEGSQWIASTVSLASRIGLLKNLEAANLYAAFSREQNAILINNAVYAKTVTYIGGSSVNKAMTLGQEVYDLVDITGVLVSNDTGALGANWANVLQQLGGNQMVNSYIRYNKAADGQSIFVYRDFTGAATVGGYYEPRAITAKVDSSFSDLGRSFRVLTTGAQNPTNTSEVRKVYGVLYETSANYVSATKTLADLKTAEIDKMVTSAQKANHRVDADSVQYNVFINGVASSYAAAKTLAGNLSTAPFRYVDNNNDGIWDSLFINTYTLGYVQSVTEDSYIIIGTGIGAIKKNVTTIATADYTPAAGDYVAYYQNSASDRYIKKLDVVTDRVLQYDGSKYTIAGNKYSFGSLADQADKAGSIALMGEGYAAVNGPVLKYTFDGPYIVLAEAAASTSFTKYGIVIGYNPSTVLGLTQIRIYTESNEYRDYFISSVNGTQTYNQAVAPGARPGENTLVAYIENGNYISLYFQNENVNGFQLLNGGQVSSDYDFSYNVPNDTWIGAGESGNVNFKNANGVMFVSYGTENTVQYATEDSLLWKAYLAGEFHPIIDGEAAFPSDASGMTDFVVYAPSNTGFNTIKAAAITFDYPGFSLPGLPLRNGQTFFGTVTGLTSVTYDAQEGAYVYTVAILEPLSTASKNVTVKSSVYALNTFVKGQIYKMYSDSEGIVRRWENASEIDSDGVDGTPMRITAALRQSNGSYQLTVVKDGATSYLTVAADANIYFVKNLFAANFETYDYTKLAAYGSIFGAAVQEGYAVYAVINLSNSTATSLWVDVAHVVEEAPAATTQAS